MGRTTKPKRGRNRAILRRHLKGESMEKIGDSYGISKQRIWQIIVREVKALDKKVE